MRTLLLFLVLIISILILSFPRFNQQDLFGLKNFTGKAEEYNISRGYYLSGDAVDYLYAVKFYRGEIDRKELKTPYVYRVMVPFIASFLPIKDALTSLNVLNILLYLTSIFFLYFLILDLGINKKYALIGIYLFGISFFPFYYLTFGNVDSGVILFVIIGLNAIIKRNNFLFFVALISGILVKETAFVLIPFYFIFQFIFRNTLTIKKTDVLFYIFVIIVPFLAMTFIRIVFSDLPQYFWTPSINLILSNLVRVKAYFSPFLTLGVPGGVSIIFLYLYFKKKLRIRFSDSFDNSEQLKLLNYFISIFSVSFLLGMYAYLAAVADGRAFMSMFIVSIILTVIMIQHFKDKKVLNSQ
ncbi:MAG: hypothetical protein JST55_10185 [Bacteroidetes bacterium]|nr:hypothetical protein [Bacteroidota bacterium]